MFSPKNNKLTVIRANIYPHALVHPNPNRGQAKNTLGLGKAMTEWGKRNKSSPTTDSCFEFGQSNSSIWKNNIRLPRILMRAAIGFDHLNQDRAAHEGCKPSSGNWGANGFH